MSTYSMNSTFSYPSSCFAMQCFLLLPHHLSQSWLYEWSYYVSPSCKNVMCNNWWETLSDDITIKLSYYLNWTISFCFKKVYFQEVLYSLNFGSFKLQRGYSVRKDMTEICRRRKFQSRNIFFKIANRRKLPRNLKTII